MINASLPAFVRCFCMERAICYRVHARTFRPPGTDHPFDARVAARDERELRDFIAAVDAAALASTYRSMVLHEVAEGSYQHRPGLPHLIRRGRRQVGGDKPNER